MVDRSSSALMDDFGGIPLVVDDRERRSRLPGLLEASGEFALSYLRLPAGDYRVGDRFLFERKTLPDLAASIVSGRLFNQAQRLVETPDCRPVLVLEGTAGDLAECGVGREAIRGALITVSVFMGLPVLRSGSPEETLKTFLYTVRQDYSIARGARPRHGYRPRGKTALQGHVLQGLPGIGPERAARLIERFGSIRAVVAAGEDELAGVDGIGPETARRIGWAVGDCSAAYGVAGTV